MNRIPRQRWLLPAILVMVLAAAGGAAPGMGRIGELGETQGAAGSTQEKTEVTIGGAKFILEGKDNRLISAAQALLSGCAKSLNLLDAAAQEEFRSCYLKKRKASKELSQVMISSAEVYLPDAPFTVSGWSFSSPGTPEAERSRQEMIAILSRPEFHVPGVGMQAGEALLQWVDKNLNAGNAGAVAEVYTLWFSANWKGPLKSIAEDQKAGKASGLPMGFGIGHNIQRPVEQAAADQGGKKTPKGKGAKSGGAEAPQGPLLGRVEARILGESQQVAVSCVLRTEQDVVGAYNVDGGSVTAVTMRLDTIGESTASARTGGVADGKVQVMTVSPESDTARQLVVPDAFTAGFFQRPKMPEAPKRERRGSASGSMPANPPVQGSFTAGWIMSPGGGWVADVRLAPGGGYLVTDREGKITGVFGRDFSASQRDSLSGFKDEAGTLFPLPVTAYTYEGSDGRHHSVAIASNQQIMMNGVWAEGAQRTAGNFADAKLFKVIATKK